MTLRRKLAELLDPGAAERERRQRQRAFLLRDTLKQVAWRQAMDLRSPDQQAAHRLINMRLDEDAKLEELIA